VILRFSLLVSITCLVACQHKPDSATPARDLKAEERFHKAGLVLIPDLQHASAWEKLIHVDMGVPASKIEVQAGAGFTTVTIKDLKNRADAEGVAQELRAIAGKQPDKFGVTKVEVRLLNAAATINPLVLPTAAAPAVPTPGSDLPTLSLPPLRIDGR
jgi:hypothetical protein